MLSALSSVTLDANGTPYSPIYGDIYHSASSGPGQALHVFLGGNNLPAAWTGKALYTIVETGFGLGLNFLVTWHAWRQQAAPDDRLHFISIEKHPFDRASLEQLHLPYMEFAELSQQLRTVLPPLVSGWHTLHFDGGRVTLTLIYADIAAALPTIRCEADAFYLDGFAPSRNPEMWSPQVIKQLSRLARPGATLATYTTARSVRDALAASQWIAEKRQGYSGKREMLVAHYQPRADVIHNATRSARRVPHQHEDRNAIVIGSGLAGSAICERLAARGWHIDLLERAAVAAPASALSASGLSAAIFQPHLSADDAIISRMARAALLYGLQHWASLESAIPNFALHRSGVLQLAEDETEQALLAKAISVAGFPPDYAQCVDRGSASQRAGISLRHGGVWFPLAGWLAPRALVAAQLAAAGSAVNMRLNCRVETIDHDGSYWHARDVDGHSIATAPVMILANAGDAVRLSGISHDLQRLRGQYTHLPATAMTSLRTVISGATTLIPMMDGSSIVGATFDANDAAPEVDAGSHAENLQRLKRALADDSTAELSALADDSTAELNGLAVDFTADLSRLAGEVGFRYAVADHLPCIGEIPDLISARDNHAKLSGLHLPQLPRRPGLYGAFAYASRGVIWSAIGAEVIASLISGEPAPLPGDLLDAIDPGRFTLKRLRRLSPDLAF